MGKGFLIATLGICLWTLIFGAVWYYASCRQAQVYNTRHVSTYTCADFFWAGGQINAGTGTIELRWPGPPAPEGAQP